MNVQRYSLTLLRKFKLQIHEGRIFGLKLSRILHAEKVCLRRCYRTMTEVNSRMQYSHWRCIHAMNWSSKSIPGAKIYMLSLRNLKSEQGEESALSKSSIIFAESWWSATYFTTSRNTVHFSSCAFTVFTSSTVPCTMSCIMVWSTILELLLVV